MKTGITVSEERLHNLVKRVSTATSEYIEMLAAAYLKETNIPAGDAELVQVIDGYKIRWYFQKKQREKFTPEYGATSNCKVCARRIVYCNEDAWLHCEPQDHGFACPPENEYEIKS